MLKVSKVKNMPLKGFLTAPEAAEEFNILKPRLLKLLNRGDIKGRKVGWIWFVRRRVMQDYVDQLKAEEAAKTGKLGTQISEIEGVAEKLEKTTG